MDEQMDEQMYKWKVLRGKIHIKENRWALLESPHLGGCLIPWFPNLVAHKVYSGCFERYMFLGYASLLHSDSTVMRWDPVIHILMSFPQNPPEDA